MNKFKFTIPKPIYVLLILSCLLNIFRIVLFNKYSLVYVIWNIFLAFLPFVISSIILNNSMANKLSKFNLIFWGIIWLLLIPNSPYIVTDLIHIGEIRAVPPLYDSFLLFSSAWTGLLLGLYSISHIEQILKMKYTQKITSLIIFVIMLFISFGMFLGRFLRFNSWDILARPMTFINGIGEIFTNSNYFLGLLLYTSLFLFFIFMSYISWKSTQTK